MLRELLCTVLEQGGYTILAAESPAKALAIAEQYPAPIPLLVTDVILPGMNGRMLAEKLASVRPDTKVLYVSGYTENVIAHRGALYPGTSFLQKPFTKEALSRKIRQLLDDRDNA